MASIISAGTTDSTSLNVSSDKTGILQLASNNATVAVTIDASQNVGIGTSSPGVKLDVAGTTNIRHTYTGATGGVLFGQYNTTGDVQIQNQSSGGIIALATNNTERMRIDSSGNVGIGTTSLNSSNSSRSLSLNGATDVAYELKSGGTFSGTLYHDGTTLTAKNVVNGAFAFGTNNTERMRIRSDGALLVGTTVEPTNVYNGFKADVNYTIISAASTTCLYVNRNTTTGEVVQIRYNNGGVGSISTNGSTTTYGTSSDYRLKENIAPMTGALTKVAQLKPVTYKWKSTGEESQGFIAHELQAVVPDCVTGEKDETEVVDIKDEEGNVIGQETKPKYQNVDTSFLVATLTAAIQEQQVIINALTARLEALENK